MAVLKMYFKVKVIFGFLFALVLCGETAGLEYGRIVMPETQSDRGQDIVEVLASLWANKNGKGGSGNARTHTTAAPDLEEDYESVEDYEEETEAASGHPSGGTGGNKRETVVDNSCQCGFKKNVDMKIVGGSLAKEHAWPWMAGLTFVRNGQLNVFCGGSLINTQYVLTAAHCVEDIIKNGFGNFRILLGTNSIANDVATNTSTATVVEIAGVTPFPNYDRDTLNNDVALIKLATPVTFNENIMSICLGQKGAPHINRRAIVAGWGALSTNSNPVNNLRNAMVKVLANNLCGTMYRKARINITPVMVCATGQRKDACRGDSGGPLFVRRGKGSQIFDQVGVVSFGQDCADPNFPGVYARVGRFMKWIKDNTKDAVYCARSFQTPRKYPKTKRS